MNVFVTRRATDARAAIVEVADRLVENDAP